MNRLVVSVYARSRENTVLSDSPVTITHLNPGIEQMSTNSAS